MLPFDCAGIFSLQLVTGYCSTNPFIFWNKTTLAALVA
jgi:hypothetical protein